MPNTLDPRMINNNAPLRINSAVVTTLSTDSILTDTALVDNLTVSTLTALNITNTDTLVTNLTATNNVVSSFFIVGADTDLVFTETDNSKTYHVNTTLTPLTTAVFSADLPNGFNVGLVNVGTGVIFLSAETTLNAIGNVNSTQHTGVLVYKHNNEFYGIGALE